MVTLSPWRRRSTVVGKVVVINSLRRQRVKCSTAPLIIYQLQLSVTAMTHWPVFPPQKTGQFSGVGKLASVSSLLDCMPTNSLGLLHGRLMITSSTYRFRANFGHFVLKFRRRNVRDIVM